MNEEFLKRLLKTFKVEAEEHIKTISEELLQYEKITDAEKRKELIHSIFREAHSLKGAARAVNMAEIEGYCQSLESVFAKLREGELQTSFKLIDDIHKGIDYISNYLNEEDNDKKLMLAGDIEQLRDELADFLTGESRIEKPLTQKKEKSKKRSPRTTTAPPPEKIVEKEVQDIPKKTEIKIPTAKLQETIRVSTKKLDQLFLKSEEMLSSKLISEELTKKIAEFKAHQTTTEKIWSGLKSYLLEHINGNGSGEFYELVSFMDSNIDNCANEIHNIHLQAYQNNKQFANMLSNLVDEMKDVLMLPFSYLSDSFPKMIRELARDLDKEIEFQISGSNIEIDRRILEEMKDAMIHLIRNCIDHGIELPETREQMDKGRVGKINLLVSKESGDKIEITLEDDGAGLNFDNIKNTAVNRNIYSHEESQTLNEEQLIDLLFHPDFSTSRVITDISGRGVGMSVVKNKINQLNGSIKVETKRNKGTKFSILLPLSLAKIRAVIIRCANEVYALQTLNIERVFRVKNELIKTVKSRETIPYNSRPIPLCTLNTVLGISPTEIVESDLSNVIVIKIADNTVAFKVDEILHEQDILIKKLNKQLEKVKFINGATILGDGRVIPVLNTHDLIKEIQTYTPSSSRPKSSHISRDFNLLIADDSITSRMLLRDILESAGYKVKMAVDGMEALTELKLNNYDLVVSDVEMPRLNGFELTKSIRNEEKINRTPVILLTALAKKEDRERGIEAGANAYIVKSGFDQTNLLETIKRLI